MLRSSLSLLIGSALAVVGCPVYDDDCSEDSGCGPGYVCHLPSRECVSTEDPTATPVRCARPSDCEPGDTCDRFGRCRRETCGEVGCVSGYTCEVETAIEHCMGDVGGGGTGGESGAANEAGALNLGGSAGG
jgi:hypothetical protein